MNTKAMVVTTLSVAVLVATIYSLSSNPSSAEHTVSNPTSFPNEVFSGKIVLVSIDRSVALEHKTSSASLTDAAIQEIGGRFFIVGKAQVPDSPDYSEYEFRRGVTVGIAWETVSEFRVFTEEQYIEYLKYWKMRREE